MDMLARDCVAVDMMFMSIPTIATATQSPGKLDLFPRCPKEIWENHRMFVTSQLYENPYEKVL